MRREFGVLEFHYDAQRERVTHTHTHTHARAHTRARAHTHTFIKSGRLIFSSTVQSTYLVAYRGGEWKAGRKRGGRKLCFLAYYLLLLYSATERWQGG